jgi:hypothetical protein
MLVNRSIDNTIVKQKKVQKTNNDLTLDRKRKIDQREFNKNWGIGSLLVCVPWVV